MLKIDIKGFDFEITFGFFFTLALTSLKDNDLGVMSLIFCILHELGHIAAMKISGIGFEGIRLYGGGIKISARGLDFMPKITGIIIYLSGPAVNFILAALLKNEARAVNLALGAFNLLPVSYFDGGKILEALVGRKISGTVSIVSVMLILSAAAYYAAVSSEVFSPSSVMTFFFMALSCFLDG